MITFSRLGKLGRFGNQLFQYTGTRLYAELNGFSSSFPRWTGTDIFRDIKSYSTSELLKLYFLPTRQLADFQAWTRLERIYSILTPFYRLPHTVELSKIYAQPRDNIDFYGYMQDELSLSLLAEHKQKVLSWLKFKNDIENKFSNALSGQTPWVGIHIRRGDFVKRGLALPIDNYINIVREKFPDKPLYIGSDDPKVKDAFTGFNVLNIKNSDENIPNFIFDFLMLCRAQTVIGCGSTFSWWAAYLGNKNDYWSPPLTHLWPKGYSPKLEKQEI